jgi:Calcineurin-like phosphoesterase
VSRLLAFGDLHCDRRLLRNLVERAVEEQCDALVSLGDLCYLPYDPEGRRFLRSAGALLRRAGLELLLVEGNHDDAEALARADARTPAPGPVPLGFRLHHLPSGTRFRSALCVVSHTAARFPSGRLEPHGRRDTPRRWRSTPTGTSSTSSMVPSGCRRSRRFGRRARKRVRPWCDLRRIALPGRRTKPRGLRGFRKSPLTDSNRRPPPYHGGFALLEWAGQTALVMAFSLQLRHFVFLTHPSLEEP